MPTTGSRAERFRLAFCEAVITQQRMGLFLAVCGGGAIGTGLRYFLSLMFVRSELAFPCATLMVNLLGSFLISFVMQLAATSSLIPPATRIVLTTGVLGGFTTYSAFNYETLQYCAAGLVIRAVAYCTLMVGGCLLAGCAGMLLGKRILL